MVDHTDDDWDASEDQITGRYSVGKLLLLRRYEQTHGFKRVALVLIGSLLPAIVVILGIELLPLGDPRDGLSGNMPSLFRSMVSHGIFTFMFLLTVKQALELSDVGYSLRRVGGIAVFTAVLLEAIWLAVSVGWGRYPVPFREFLGIAPWSVLVVVGHLLFARGEILAKKDALTLYLPVLGADMALFFLFIMLAAGFASVPGSIQIAMVLSFPLIKVVVKKWLWMYSKHVRDLTVMVTICMVEISGALYQTLCLQYATTFELSALIMLMDFLQVALEVRMYLGDEGLMDTTLTVAPALKLLEDAIKDQPPTNEPDARSSAKSFDTNPPAASRLVARSVLVTESTLSALRGPRAFNHARILPQPAASPPTAQSSSQQVDGIVLPNASESQVQSVEHALHRIFSCEVLVFVEYMEIFMPLVYSLYIRVASHIPHARRYNLMLASMTAAQVHATTTNALSYAVLEAVSFGLMCWFMKSQYGISPLHQLAFVLEKYWMTLQGKLVGCFVAILCSITMHQGVDFTFRFDYEALLSGINIAANASATDGS